jgi:peroxiredoxin
MENEMLHKIKITDLIVGCLVGLSLTATAVMAIRVNTLAAALKAARPASAEPLAIGAAAPAFGGKLLGGSDIEVRYSDVKVPTVLYVFTPQCGWCKRNADNLRRIAELSRLGRIRLIGVSLTNLKLTDYVAEQHFSFPILTDVPGKTIREYALGGTPQTIVVSPDGRVIKNWSGAYSNGTEKEVEQYFGISLPGLSALTTRPKDEVVGNK